MQFTHTTTIPKVAVSYHTTFLFGKSHVQFAQSAALRPAVLTEVFHVLLQSVQAFSGLVNVIRPQDFHFTPGNARL